ncbi:MAG TPA: hypothetical protein VFM61_05635 [Pseudidiomarina sp.]|nr:hypothetical protein [Pseudidiomarina sp.]
MTDVCTRYRQSGSGLVETILFLGVFSWLMSSGLVWIWGLGTQALAKINTSRSSLLQPLWQLRQGSLNDDDHFARSVKPILSPLKRWGEIELTTATLRVISATEDTIAAAVLEDSWAPRSFTDLTRRQQNLTSTGQLSRLGLQNIVNGFGVLPIARELNASSIRFGWSNPDATLYELRCKETSCDK